MRPDTHTSDSENKYEPANPLASNPLGACLSVSIYARVQHEKSVWYFFSSVFNVFFFLNADLGCDSDKLDVKNQVGVGRNESAANCFAAVRQFGGNNHHALAAYFHGE